MPKYERALAPRETLPKEEDPFDEHPKLPYVGDVLNYLGDEAGSVLESFRLARYLYLALGLRFPEIEERTGIPRARLKRWSRQGGWMRTRLERYESLRLLLAERAALEYEMERTRVFPRKNIRSRLPLEDPDAPLPEQVPSIGTEDLTRARSNLGRAEVEEPVAIQVSRKGNKRMFRELLRGEKRRR